MHNSSLKKLIILIVATIMIGAMYLLIGLDFEIFEYQFSSRLRKLFLMILVGAAIAASTVIFQAITVNRLLTPSIMGLDAVYLFSKVLILFIFGASSIFITNFYLNFAVTLVVMIIFALILFEGIFKYGQFSVYFILLIGVILGTFFRSITGFLELLINPEDFLVVQSAMFANFDGANPTLVTLSAIALTILLLVTVKVLPYLDVLLLGRAQAINLGVNYTQMTRMLLILVALMVAIATALVGPITFLGLLTINLAHELIKNFEHRYILPATICISWISLFIAQWIVENLFEATTQVSILINLIGGIYFIYLLMRRRETT
ncbi:iron chelate uptake ABC transporter family permease subunit [Staphylococcus agnetis]|uniref:iron chelate uptake ABC transporter family permease subunit n=1 Tax=Staphylococcus agnetis TaxID=985762 RepID=UPI00208E32DE|nr:iron chelate uptake ABC transporter family permease subunit [Staphylococcus agnetis]MCO4345505.1 iron chelate uptake ABC transporter family permease subunit [Staphylococcus agnetis]MCO4355139.1 iron chelate uptake ABC transporter family permease subunit [Staphylococcus agnetis]MCO4359895.1 iron chelate uptake ABC transporter family permease subunit [Staphylococcus agnetis]MCO4363817.1 iron chelate uptake ABC transporter family permease subunit [Staphylococcus agnetis]MCO4371651.1 iron chela